MELDDAWKDWVVKLKPEPNLTIVIQNHPNYPSKLVWSFHSGRNAVQVPDPVLCEAGNDRMDFANLLASITQRDASIKGIGHLLIGKKVPREFWLLLKNVTKKSTNQDVHPTILILSQDPYIPWELAREDKDSPFLAAIANVGRWTLPDKNIDQWSWPPSEIHIKRAICVSGENAPEKAKDEAKYILKMLTEKNMPSQMISEIASMDSLRTHLSKKDLTNQLLHFALHGKFDTTHRESGLEISNNEYLDCFEISKSENCRNIFIFLNACSVGRVQSLLNSNIGIAEAFLEIGASATIAPLWDIDDVVALDVAQQFYKKAFKGKERLSVAEIFSEFYKEFEDGSKTSSTYLAYRFYGNPALRLLLSEVGDDVA